jgi:hypothetical protein
VKYLEQAGVRPTFFNLGAMGIHGNGQLMMLEKDSDQIADVMEKWVGKSIAEIALLSALLSRGARAALRRHRPVKGSENRNYRRFGVQELPDTGLAGLSVRAPK